MSKETNKNIDPLEKFYKEKFQEERITPPPGVLSNIMGEFTGTPSTKRPKSLKKHYIIGGIFIAILSIVIWKYYEHTTEERKEPTPKHTPVREQNQPLKNEIKPEEITTAPITSPETTNKEEFDNAEKQPEIIVNTIIPDSNKTQVDTLKKSTNGVGKTFSLPDTLKKEKSSQAHESDKKTNPLDEFYQKQLKKVDTDSLNKLYKTKKEEKQH